MNDNVKIIMHAIAIFFVAALVDHCFGTCAFPHEFE